jgi:hypothetical protein
MRGDIDQVEVRKELLATSADLRSQLSMAVAEFEKFHTGVQQTARKAAGQSDAQDAISNISRVANAAADNIDRAFIVGYFAGPKRPLRRSFSTWLLEFVFADRGVRQQSVMCCDACQQPLIDRQGPLAFVNRVLGGEQRAELGTNRL